MITKENQSFFDLATQASGDLRAVLDIALANGISITDDPVAGKKYLIPNDKNVNFETAEYFNANNIELATGQLTQEQQADGIGVEFWQVGVNFTIS